MCQFARRRISLGKRSFTSRTFRSSHPSVERLESRALLTAVVVNTVVDAIFPPNTGLISLRSALATANGSATPTTITFDPTVFEGGQTIVLNGSGLVLNSDQPTTITTAGAVSIGVTIDGNSQGTALQISGAGHDEIDGLQFLHGSAGCMSSHSTLTLNNVYLDSSTGGAGFSNFATATLNGVIIFQDVSTTAGGGIYNATGATVTMNNGQISSNQSTDGGGIDNAGGTVVLNNELINSNTCTGTTSRGGGVLNQGGTVTLNGITLYQNSSGNGGGADNALGTMTLLNTTVNANTASTDGGGVSNGDPLDSGSGTVTITNCTIAGNTGKTGGGLYAGAGRTTFIANSIVAGNILAGTGAVGPDADGLQASLGHNIVGKIDGSVGSWSVNDLTGTTGQPLNAMLTPLASYGGPSPTLVPLAGSPAIDAGLNAYAVDASNAPLTTDERGFPRISHGTVDIGADEFQPNQINFEPGNNAVTVLRSPDHRTIFWGAGTTGGNFLTADPEGAIINGNGANDVVMFDYSLGGDPVPTPLHLNGTFTFSGLQGTDPLAGINLDIGQSTVYFPYANAASDPIAIFISYIQEGYNNGLWNGTGFVGDGIITSAAAAATPNHSTGIGYADSADGLVPLPANTIELKYTLYGDTGLTGTVGFTDFMRLTQHYTLTGQTWGKGDFNYDGTIDSNDFNLLKPNYGQTLPAPAPTAAPAPVMTPIVSALPVLARPAVTADPTAVSSTSPTDTTHPGKTRKSAAKGHGSNKRH